jgi:hypothetical protein
MGGCLEPVVELAFRIVLVGVERVGDARLDQRVHGGRCAMRVMLGHVPIVADLNPLQWRCVR